LAGQLADRSEKSRMIYFNKVAELCICLTGTLTLAIGALPLMLAVLFALGIQSAMFGPNKYAVLPQLLPYRLFRLLRRRVELLAGTPILSPSAKDLGEKVAEILKKAN